MKEREKQKKIDEIILKLKSIDDKVNSILEYIMFNDIKVDKSIKDDSNEKINIDDISKNLNDFKEKIKNFKDRLK